METRAWCASIWIHRTSKDPETTPLKRSPPSTKPQEGLTKNVLHCELRLRKDTEDGDNARPRKMRLSSTKCLQKLLAPLCTSPSSLLYSWCGACFLYASPMLLNRKQNKTAARKSKQKKRKSSCVSTTVQFVGSPL